MQVSRRLVSLLQTLAEQVPDQRREALTDRLNRTHTAISAAFTDPRDRAQTGTPDRQGLGASRTAGP